MALLRERFELMVSMPVPLVWVTAMPENPATAPLSKVMVLLFSA